MVRPVNVVRRVTAAHRVRWDRLVRKVFKVRSARPARAARRVRMVTTASCRVRPALRVCKDRWVRLVPLVLRQRCRVLQVRRDRKAR